MTDKVIVTNMTALKSKYKPAGIKAIDAAVKKMIAADKERGLKTIVVALDDAKAMKDLGAKPVADASSFKENKTAIDGVYAALAPDYLMILGAIDVVPHQDLKNPLFTTDPDGDTEKFAFGDVPRPCQQVTPKRRSAGALQSTWRRRARRASDRPFSSKLMKARSLCADAAAIHSSTRSSIS